MPEHATLIRAECTFDRDSCAWRNTTTGDFEWRMAAVARRPANLPDKTYGMLLDLFITIDLGIYYCDNFLTKLSIWTINLDASSLNCETRLETVYGISSLEIRKSNM